MDRPRLTYFELRGRAEPARIFLHASEIAFEDRRVETREDWDALLPTLPFGQLPLLEHAGLRLAQSHAILRHLGRTLGKDAPDERERVALEVAQEALAEAQEDLWRFHWTPSYYDHLAEYAERALAPCLARLERWLARDGGAGSGWFGRDFGPVDALAFGFLDEVDAFFPVLLARVPGLEAHRSRVAALPGVARYLASPSRPAVFGMGSMGPKVDPRRPVSPEARLANPWTDPIDLARVLRHQRRLQGGEGP